MAKNKLSDLNNHLFAQLERLNEEDLNDQQIKNEVSRAKAISGIASQVIKSAKVTIDAMKLVANGDYTVNELPEMIGAPTKKANLDL
jgi:hypothetical protein